MSSSSNINNIALNSNKENKSILNCYCNLY